MNLLGPLETRDVVKSFQVVHSDGEANWTDVLLTMIALIQVLSGSREQADVFAGALFKGNWNSGN